MKTHTAQSQRDRIMSHLKRGWKLDRAQAFQKYGIANVTARIAELRQEGNQIKDYWVECLNQFNEATRHKVYFLERQQ